MKKVVSLLVILLTISIIFEISTVYAADAGVTKIIENMAGTSNPVEAGGTKVGGVINNVIGLLQVVGTGISIIVITILGIKYILASPGEKADIKKSAIPIVIGCVLLFGAVNLMAAVEEFSTNVLNNG